ncbi:MAG: hypothetical protein JWN99_468 [Ilumatobacteraceae bacterium]|jgi:hypothetical protein|nr:hypothetical protein [Ilumatobacteraceae bacterium]
MLIDINQNAHPRETQESNTMGFFKQMKDMKEMVHAAPGMIDQAQVMAAQANQMKAMHEQQSQAATAAAFANPAAVPGLTPDLLEPVAGVTVQQYVTVVKGVAAYNYDQSMLPTLAAGQGIDRESWDAASAAFNARVTGSPAFAQHFNTLYRAA